MPHVPPCLPPCHRHGALLSHVTAAAADAKDVDDAADLESAVHQAQVCICSFD